MKYDSREKPITSLKRERSEVQDLEHGKRSGGTLGLGLTDNSTSIDFLLLTRHFQKPASSVKALVYLYYYLIIVTIIVDVVVVVVVVVAVMKRRRYVGIKELLSHHKTVHKAPSEGSGRRPEPLSKDRNLIVLKVCEVSVHEILGNKISGKCFPGSVILGALPGRGGMRRRFRGQGPESRKRQQQQQQLVVVARSDEHFLPTGEPWIHPLIGGEFEIDGRTGSRIGPEGALPIRPGLGRSLMSAGWGIPPEDFAEPSEESSSEHRYE
uniref:Uncharacterized protein n=1 Tax=Anopheles atroparvus TaxID=41427 RepID=A0A182ITT0_ANOAO